MTSEREAKKLYKIFIEGVFFGKGENCSGDATIPFTTHSTLDEDEIMERMRWIIDAGYTRSPSPALDVELPSVETIEAIMQEHGCYSYRAAKTNPRRFHEKNQWNYKMTSKAYALVREWQRRNPEKLKAHQILSWAVQSKKIIRPNRCSKCNKSSSLGIIQAHHSDYSKPLDVIWLCCTCHRGAHRKKFCIHGHKLDAENIYIRLDRGTRSCKKCANNATKRYQKKIEIKNVRENICPADKKGK